jgi:Flp pilus assembly protein TadG
MRTRKVTGPRRTEEGEKGASLFEFAIALPFLFTIIASAVQFGSALNEYMVLTDAVHQAARLAASSIRLASNNEISNATLTQTGCPVGGASFTGTSTDLQNHRMVQQRVENLVADAKTLISSSPLCVTTGAKDGNPVTPGQRNVYVRASIQLGGFFQAFGTVPLTVEAEAPILQ